MFTITNTVLSLVLLISVGIILGGKVLIGLKGTDSGVINLFLVVLGLAGLYCSLSVFLGIFGIGNLTAAMNEKNISVERIVLLKQEISQVKTSNVISLIVGYISLVLDFIMFKVIEKKKKNELTKEKNHWNLNKLN